MLKNVDPVVVKETRFIGMIVLILSVLMQAIFLMIGKWDYTVLTGNLLGAALAVGNFFFMAVTVQKVVGLAEADVKKKLHSSQQLRLVVMLVVCVIGAAAPCFNTLSVLIPQFFPRIGVSIRGLILKEK